jgi:hypothetical protein
MFAATTVLSRRVSKGQAMIGDASNDGGRAERSRPSGDQWLAFAGAEFISRHH